MSRSRIDPYDLIISGKATDQDIEEYLGPQLIMELGAQWIGEDETLRSFRRWYRRVMAPIGINPYLCYQLYIGEISSLEFESHLDEATTQRFLEQFESLQRAYLKFYHLDGNLA